MRMCHFCSCTAACSSRHGSNVPYQGGNQGWAQSIEALAYLKMDVPAVQKPFLDEPYAQRVDSGCVGLCNERENDEAGVDAVSWKTEFSNRY